MMAKNDRSGLMVALNGQTVPPMQRVATGTGGTRGATIPQLQPVGQGSGGVSSTGNSGPKGKK